VRTDDANRQHYEVPADFFEIVLGPYRKYSSAWFADGQDDLGKAEAAMLTMTCDRAELADGQHILELGCGWGSLTLFMAERYPRAHIVAVSNSHRQRTAILARAAAAGLTNVEVITADLVAFASDRRFDRVVSVECFEHMRNHRELFRRIRGWLHPDGCCFVHVFTHRSACYPFEDGGDEDWMARHFFAGGMMLSDEWFLRLQDDLVVDGHWRVSGHHYARTARHWLQRLDRHRSAVEAVFRADGLDARAARLQSNRWRIFFIACEELWGFAGGSEWHVSHYRFKARA
jgi:cyclopropane-fatty-acyl-phospholipid synthase